MSVLGQPIADSSKQVLEDDVMTPGLENVTDQEQEDIISGDSSCHRWLAMFTFLVVCAYSCVHLFLDVSGWLSQPQDDFKHASGVYVSSPHQIRYSFDTNQVTPVMLRTRNRLFDVVPPPLTILDNIYNPADKDEHDLTINQDITNPSDYEEHSPVMLGSRKHESKNRPSDKEEENATIDGKEDKDSTLLMRPRNNRWEVAPPPKINIYKATSPSDDVDENDLPPVKIIIHKRKHRAADSHDEHHLPVHKIILHNKRQRKESYTRSQSSDSIEFSACDSDPCVFQIANGEESSEDVVLEIRRYKEDTEKTACAIARNKHSTSMQRLRSSDFDVDIYGSCGHSEIFGLDTASQTNATTRILALILN